MYQSDSGLGPAAYEDNTGDQDKMVSVVRWCSCDGVSD